MFCKKCKKQIPENSVYCLHCGKKQESTPKKRTHKRAHGTGTIRKDSRYSNPYIALSPADFAGKRQYIGSYSTYAAAQQAIEIFCRNGMPELHNATVAEIYALWSGSHFPTVSDNTAKLYTSMWKRFEPLYKRKIADLKTPDFQKIVDTAASKSTAHIIQVIAQSLCRYAVENDIVNKNYAEFVILPKGTKSDKPIFSRADLSVLWDNSADFTVKTILALIYTGFRLGEFLALTPENIHFEEGYIIGGGKTEAGTNRIVPFPGHIPEIRNFFENWCRDKQPNEKIFPYTLDEYRGMFYDCLIELHLLNAQRKDPHKSGYIFADNPHITPHSTRHTYASLASSAGIAPENLQKLIGHASYSTTANIYIHQDIDLLSAEMSKLSR